MPRVILLALLSSVGFLTAGDGPVDEAWRVIDRGLESGDFEHRRQTLMALAAVDGSNHEAVRRVVEAMKSDKDARVRQDAALALGQMKATSAIPDLKAALGDHSEVAFAAAKALTELGDPSGRDTLIAVLAGTRSANPGMMTNVVREAQHRIKHPEGMVLLGADAAAGTMFAPASMGLTAIEQTAGLRTKGSPGRAAAAAYLEKDPDPYAVTLLEWALNDDSKAVRIAAAKALAKRGNPESIGKLDPLLKDDHNAVRTMAAAAILEISGKKAGATNEHE
jgi:HEAT repeat protein